MELDALRRHWQAQPAPLDSAAAVPAAGWSAPPAGLVEKMRRNAQWEMALTILVALGLPAFIALASLPVHRLYGAVMLLIAGIMLFYYYQKLGLLARMARPDGSVQGHLEDLYEGLRALLRFYYRLTLATGPIILLLLAGYHVGRELARPGTFRWEFIGLLLGALLLFGVLLQVAVVYGTRWYLQKLYGRHLDQLEAALRELRD